MSVLGCGVIEESLAAAFLVSELVGKSVFNHGQIRGRKNTKDLWGLQHCCKPELLTCQQQILTSFYYLVFALLCQRRGAEKHFREGGDSRSGTDRGFPLGRDNECSVHGKRCGGTGWEGGKEPISSAS